MTVLLPVYRTAVNVTQGWFFVGTDLRKAREALGLTVPELAKRCGWSETWQGRLEKPGIKRELTESIKNSLILAGIHIDLMGEKTISRAVTEHMSKNQ